MDSRGPSALLDWILASNPVRIIKSGVMSDALSDLSIIYCVWKTKIPKSPPKYRTVRQVRNIDVEHFSNDLIAINWDRFQMIPFVEEAWNFFYSEV